LRAQITHYLSLKKSPPKVGGVVLRPNFYKNPKGGAIAQFSQQ